MRGVVVVDANLLTLLVVGGASKDFIGKHKRLRSYSVSDFELLVELIGGFSEFVLLPHILAEVSSLARQIENPAKAKIRPGLRS